MMAYEIEPAKAHRPSAVVLIQHHDLVLALTRGTQIHDLHLPGGKLEDRDRGDLRNTAARELAEETGLYLWPDTFLPLCRFVAHTGRPVEAFTAVRTEAWRLPESFKPRLPAGYPGWVPPRALLQPWCTFRWECEQILAAAGVQC